MPFEPVTITLTEPVMHGKEEITEIVFDKPMRGKYAKGTDLSKNPSQDDLVTIGAKLTGYPPNVLYELVWPDFVEVLGTVGDFLEDGQRTGEKA